ncbi:MAG: hypothetical protein AVDCRST_MAG93-4499 [uncultured Chloroflexia bacterium]|uniref:Uncharacterized protein n=1 Tax=uncultured Chloroflexia bacterium TaxID=1672391 RepID=A0A6J4K989_9CHLR|nr:MAG: hypothetical protein AVDCRST_MAG93-4499 [uncultured Chloroflexia bacterium]
MWSTPRLSSLRTTKFLSAATPSLRQGGKDLGVVGRRGMSGEKRPRRVESVLSPRGSEGRDRTTNSTPLVLRAFQVALKYDYNGL